MSKETLEWLNENTMLGFTANREKYKGMGWVTFDESDGTNKAWWYQDGYEHGYPGAIPVEEIIRVLFNWTPVESAIMHQVWDGVDEVDADGQDDRGYFKWVADDRFKGILHPTTGYVFGTFGIDSYQVHSYSEWLLKAAERMVDSELGFASAGLLRSGGVAYAQAELPDCIEVAGMDIRPGMLAATSCDGTKATQYKLTTNISICDNSLEVNLSEDTPGIKIRHSSKSLGRINDAREALGLLYKHTEDMVQFLDTLSNVDVTDAQFRQIVDTIKPIPEPIVEVTSKGVTTKNQRGITIAENTQADLWNMWSKDARAKQWNGTLLGAFQSVNTWHNHERSNNDNGVERVMTATLSGDVGRFDAEFFQIVQGIDGLALPEGLLV